MPVFLVEGGGEAYNFCHKVIRYAHHDRQDVPFGVSETHQQQACHLL